jgi:isopenicillin N synthase-like dioxygenase
MPGLLETGVKPEIPTWSRPAETIAELDWAPLVIIDLSKFDEPGGKQALADDLHQAVQRWGFWTVINSGIDDALVVRQLSIGQAFFNLPVEEKRKAPCDFSVGKWVQSLRHVYYNSHPENSTVILGIVNPRAP